MKWFYLFIYIIMASKKKFVKFTIIFILVFFVAVTWLSMIVPYIGGAKNAQGTGDVLTWEDLTGTTNIETGVVDSMGL
jgi:hypothetical protein